MKRILALSMAMLAVLLFTGCAGGNDADSHMEGTQRMESSASETPGVDSDDTESAQNEPETDGAEQMPLLAEKNIDYAFFCCDGIYNMGLDEAAECAGLVGAKHNIPYHVTAKEGVVFDRELAEQFEAPKRLIVEAGEEIIIE